MKQAPLALITGSARRIGKALAIALHAKGYNVAVHFNNSKESAESLSNQLNKQRSNSTKVFKAELTNEIELESMVKQIFDWQNNLTVVINNASLFLDDTLAQKNWHTIFDCNVKAPYILSSLCFDKLKQNKGSIINITDQHAQSPLKNYDIYCMTKAALESQTKSLAKSFAPDVRVNAIAPGAILWPEDNNELSDEIKTQIIEQTPLQKIGSVQPIIQAVLHFIENEFITGTSLMVNGGRHLGNSK